MQIRWREFWNRRARLSRRKSLCAVRPESPQSVAKAIVAVPQPYTCATMHGRCRELLLRNPCLQGLSRNFHNLLGSKRRELPSTFLVTRPNRHPPALFMPESIAGWR